MLALVVLLLVRSTLPADVHWWIWTCVCGLAMGLFGLWYVPFLKRRRARIAARRAAHAEDQPARAQPPGSPAAEPEPSAAQLSEPASGYVSRDNGSNTV